MLHGRMDLNLPDDEVASAIVRVLSGDLPEREEVELRHWLDADPGRRQLFQEMRAVWDEAGIAADTPDGWATGALRRRIVASRDAIKHVARRSPALARLRGRRRFAPQHMAVAAGLILLALGGVTWSDKLFPARTVASAPLREVSTKRGQRATVQLLDGSRVTLGAASTLRYPDRIDTTATREVLLTGEAYFEIAHEEKRPFAVRTPLGVARDLGTKFVVRALPDVQYVDVVVVEGLVSLKGAKAASRDSLLLRAADLGRLDSAGNIGVERNTNLSDALAWTRGDLVFRNTPVTEVVASIARTYDVDVGVTDPLLREVRFSGSFEAAPAAQVVADFARAIGANVETDQGGFLLIRKGDR